MYKATVSGAGMGINASEQNKDRLDKNINKAGVGGGWEEGKKA